VLVSNLLTYSSSWRTLLIAAGVIALLCLDSTSASAHERASRVIVMEDAGTGSGPERAVQALGGHVDRQIPLIDGFSARVPRSAVRALRGTPGVLSAHRDRSFSLRSTDDASLAPPSTTLDALRGIVGADTVSGGAVDVALVDSGVSPDPALAGHVVDGPDFSEDARFDELRSLDAFGHGTHLAGIIAAVAPRARVVSVKVADRDGSTTLGRILAGIDWTVRRGDRDGMNIRVLNLAFGAEPERSYRNDPLAFAVERAWDSGLAVVTSAGNGGDASESLDSPAYDPYVIAVGAEDSGGTTTLADDRMAPFSSRGSETRSPDVAAPGVAIVSTRVPGSFLDEAFPAARIGDGFRGSGTSQAAAVVSGATALLVGGRPSLVPDQVKALLRSTARPLPATDESVQGAGVVNVAAAAGAPATSDRQRFPNARGGGWLHGAITNQLAAETHNSSGWSGNRWTGNRWTGNRWTGNRWTGNRWTGNRWTGNRWTGNRWTGNRWTSIESGGGS
jgi:serine protease AprX